MTNKKKISAKKISLIIFVNIVLLFLLVLAFGREYVSNLQIEREIARLEERREALRADQADRLRMIQELSSEYYLERQAREKHGLANDGERLIIIKSDEDSLRIGIDVPEEESEPMSNLETWFYYFFDSSRLR